VSYWAGNGDPNGEWLLFQFYHPFWRLGPAQIGPPGCVNPNVVAVSN